MLNRSEWGRYWAAEEVVDRAFSVVAAHVVDQLEVFTYRCVVASFEEGRRTVSQYRWFAKPDNLVPVVACVKMIFDAGGWPIDVQVYVRNNDTHEVSFETKLSRVPNLSPDELARRLRVMVGLVKSPHVLKLLVRSTP
jgi:hypothetical protein